MKRFLPFLAIAALLLSALPTARGADLSINFFYDNLGGGNWYEVADYGYVWQPDAATNSSWRPYTDGYWAYTDQGWTWVSYEDFGWATYHYGRWSRLADYGWVWVPGYEWGPAWVSWRTGGDTIGWAPLPPPRGGREVVYESRPITSRVDIDFDIGPAYYNFIDLRYIGEPVLRDRIYPYNRNVTYISNTVNVTNITFNNSVVYNYGPDFATVNRYSTRPIQRLTIQHENLNPTQAVRVGNVNKVQGDKLVLGAPMRLQRAQGQQIAPQKVKAKIAQPKFETGWSDVKNPTERAQLEQKIKTENPKNVARPSLQPNAGGNNAAKANAPVARDAAVGAGAGASPAPSVPMERTGKGKHKGEKAQTQPGASVSPVAPEGANTRDQREGKKNPNRGQRQTGMSPGVAATAAPVGTAATNEPALGAGENAANNAPGKHDRKAEPRNENAVGNGNSERNRDRGEKSNRKQERMNEGRKPNATPPQANEVNHRQGGGEQIPRGERSNQRGGEQVQSRQRGPQQPAGNKVGKGQAPEQRGQAQGGEAKGKKNKPNASPTPPGQ